MLPSSQWLMCQDVKAMAKTFLPNNFIYRKDSRTNQNATDYCASCCLSLYFGLHGSYTAEKQPLFASHYTQQKSRGCVPLRTLLLFCLSTTRTRSQSSWIWSSWKSRLCVRTQKSTQPQEVDVKCPLSRNERGHRLHFEKSSETGRVYESQIQWCYWWTIAVHNRGFMTVLRSVTAMPDDIRHFSIQHCSCDLEGNWWEWCTHAHRNILRPRCCHCPPLSLFRREPRWRNGIQDDHFALTSALK